MIALARTAIFSVLMLTLWGCPGTDPVLECDPTDNTPCHDGYLCDVDVLICRKACETDSDCLTSQYCDDRTGEGMCKLNRGVQPGDSDGGDSGGD